MIARACQVAWLSLTTSHFRPPTTNHLTAMFDLPETKRYVFHPLSFQSHPLTCLQRPPHQTIQILLSEHPQCRPPPRFRLRHRRVYNRFAAGTATLLRRPRFPALLDHAKSHTKGPDPAAIRRRRMGAASPVAEAASNVLRPN